MRFHERRFAEEYDKRLSDEGYPGNLLNVILDNLSGSTVLDIGAGSGFFSIPLAEKGYFVTAIEPSMEMIRIFRRKTHPEIAQRIIIIHSDWESFSGEKYDCALCAHSIYPMKDMKIAVKKMKATAQRTLLLVKHHSNSLSDTLRRSFLNIRNSETIAVSIIKILRDENIPYSCNEVKQVREHVIHDLEEEVRYYCDFLGIDTTESDRVRKIILAHAYARSGSYVYKSEYQDKLLIF